MAVPLVIAGVMAASAAAQLYSAEKARGAEKSRLNEIKRMYEGLIPPDYDLSIEDPPELHQQRLQMPEFSGSQAEVQWNLDKLKPEELKLVQKYIPQVAPLIYEAAPKLIEKTPEMKQGIDAQKAALRKFMSIGEGDGFDPEYQQRVQNARQRAQTEAQSRSASTMQDFERRGLGGSGLELAAKIGASSQAMDRNAQMGLAAEAEAYRNQLNSLAQGAQIGGQLRAQDEAFQGRNADIINSFNQRMSKRYQDWEAMRSDAMNQADLRNIQEAQRISDYNTNQRNLADQNAQRRTDESTRFNEQARTRERDRQDALAKWSYDQRAKERGYQDSREILQAQWRQGNTDRMNQLEDKRFANQHSILGGQTGLAESLNRANIGATQDRNAAIQGLSNIAATYGVQKSNQDHQEEMYKKYGSNQYQKGGY